MKKLIYSLALIFTMTNAAWAMQFNDIPHGFWAYNEIDRLTNEGIISGYSDNTYLPQKLVTRAEYAAMIIKALGQETIPIQNMYTFEDIGAEHWAWSYVLRALNLDILKPAADGYFYPDDYITRSEVITLLSNILKTEHISKKEAIIALQNSYIDFDDIPDWFKVTAGKAEAIGVIAKEPPRQNYLDYDAYVTRAQIAVFLANMKEKTDFYLAERIAAEKAPKKATGIIIENVQLNGDVITVPERTVLPITIIGQISTENAKAGEMFQAKFANNIVDYEHNLIFSNESILIGKILDSIDGRPFVRNGELLFELSAVNNKNLLTKILGVAEYQATNIEANKVKKAWRGMFKGREFTAKDGQILYIKLYKPIRVNVVTGEIFD